MAEDQAPNSDPKTARTRTSAGQYYERYWSDEGYKPSRDSIPTHLEKLYERYVGETDDCLDLGCGDGSASGPYLARHAGSYVGADISERAVHAAQERGLKAITIDDAGKLPFGDASFDVVVCIEVLEHLYEPQLAAAEALRVLRPGGRFLATVPNAAHWRDRVDSVLGIWHPAGDDLGRAEPWRSPHIRFFRPATLERMLMSVGFAHVSVVGRPVPLLDRVPLARRLNRKPGLPSTVAVRLSPTLFASGLTAVAIRP